jgi:hypothetical protein
MTWEADPTRAWLFQALLLDAMAILYKKKWSRHCTKDKTYGAVLWSMDLAVVFHAL